MTDLNAALESFKPALVASYKAIVTGQFDRMVARLGPALKGVGNDWDFARMYRSLVAPVIVAAESDPVTRRTLAYVIDPVQLKKLATMFADSAIYAWKGKVEAKMGQLEGANVHRLDGVSFLISGAKGGVPVSIHQQMITNVSPRGTLFNQFPARIYRDGKAISEAKFKAL